MNKSIQKKGRQSNAVRRIAKRSKRSDILIQYVFPLGNGWVVKNSKASKFTFITDSKREAVHFARSMAKRRGEILTIYGKDWKIAERKKYRKNY